MITLRISAVIGVAGALLLAGAAARAEEAIREIGKQATGLIKDAEFDSLFKEADLATRYVSALDGLEKKLAAAGDVDAIIRLREERDAVRESGTTTAHTDAAIVELRQKYEGALKVIRDSLAATKAKVAADVTQKFRQEEMALVKAGKVEEALAARKEGERLLLELAANSAVSADVPFEDDPRATGPAERKDLSPIAVPRDQPPANDAIFATKGRWLEAVTVPAVKQRLREGIVIGDKGKNAWPLVVVAPGNVWSAGDNIGIELLAGRFVATKARFEKLNFLADLNSVFYFTNCAFDDAGFGKGGSRVGGDHAAKFFFDKCLVKGRYSKSVSIRHVGLRAESTIFQDVEFPSVKFMKRQPATFVNDPWMRLVNCRFVNCTLPASFLTLTRDCAFEGCTFTDDSNREGEAEITRLMEVPIYVSNCKSRMARTSPNLKFVEKPLSALQGGPVPTLGSLSSLLPP